MEGGITYASYATELELDMPIVGLPADSMQLVFRAPATEAEQRRVAALYPEVFRWTGIGGAPNLKERRMSSVPEPMVLYPGYDEYWVVLLLEVAYFPRAWSVVSDTDLDFYSGDYGAYFDSLEIELEPVKKAAKA